MSSVLSYFCYNLLTVFKWMLRILFRVRVECLLPVRRYQSCGIPGSGIISATVPGAFNNINSQNVWLQNV